MAIFYVETGMGACLEVGRADGAEAVRRRKLREVGTCNGVQVVRIATRDDIAAVAAMGGWVPKEGKNGAD